MDVGGLSLALISVLCTSLQALLSMTSPFSCRAREVTCHYGHVNHFYYLLTYYTVTLCVEIAIKHRST